MNLKYKEMLEIGNKESEVGVVCLWTKREYILKYLDSKNYYILGNLYSRTPGINALIRNYFANKNIRYLAITGVDLNRSGEALIGFMKNGVNENHEIVGFEDVKIDKNISRTDLDNFRKNIKLLDLRNIKDYSELNNRLEALPKLGSWGEPQYFEEQEIGTINELPSEISGFSIHEDFVYDAWIKILHHIFKFGVLKNSEYGEEQRELLNMCVVIKKEDPDSIKFNENFPFSEKELEKYFPQVLSGNKIDGVEYTYGQRLFNFNGKNQIGHIIEKLKNLNFSRRGVAVLWDYEKDAESKNPPCLIFVGANIQNNALHLTALLRSNDMYRAWPMNAFALRKLQKYISSELKMQLGMLTIISTSAHIYEHDFKVVENIIQNNPIVLRWNPDPRGNIVIHVEDNLIKAIHLDKRGDPVNIYTGTSALEIYKKLVSNLVVSQISHAFDIGAELQKAEIALKNKKIYIQDKELFI